MPQLGRKYTCYSCHTKFYDLGKPTPLCPKCGADQRDAEETPVVTTGRGRAARIVEEPAEEPEFADAESSTSGGGGGGEGDEEDDAGFSDADREEEAEEDEDEDY